VVNVGDMCVTDALHYAKQCPEVRKEDVCLSAVLIRKLKRREDNRKTAY
jgi:hypothetical protein